MTKSEVVIVPTYQRPEFLHCCLKRIFNFEPDMIVSVFPDRGTYADHETQQVVEHFALRHHVQLNFVPRHDYYGNSYNALEAMRWAFNEGYEKVYYVEDDVMVHADFFSWHREVHEEVPELFASMAWVFNRYVPLTDDVLYQRWYYAIGTCFQRAKLRLIVEHATPRYYDDMAKYVGEVFADSMLNKNRRQFGIEHYEQDGLIQRVLDRDRTTTASAGVTKCTHIGVFGYNRGWSRRIELFAGCKTFEDRVNRVEALIADPYERAEYFGRDVVEREIARALPKRIVSYRATMGPWSTEFTSERTITHKSLPAYVNSVRVSDAMIIEKIG